MSVREQLFVRTDGSPAEVAEFAAKLIGGRAEVRGQQVWLLVDTARLVPGVDGEFGGPVMVHNSAAALRPGGEFEAPDAYDMELRLWQAIGPRVEPATGADVEGLAATAIFRTLAASAELAAALCIPDDAAEALLVRSRTLIEELPVHRLRIVELRERFEDRVRLGRGLLGHGSRGSWRVSRRARGG